MVSIYQGLGYRVLAFRGLGFRDLALRVQDLGKFRIRMKLYKFSERFCSV